MGYKRVLRGQTHLFTVSHCVPIVADSVRAAPTTLTSLSPQEKHPFHSNDFDSVV